jgi:hypothetical protein
MSALDRARATTQFCFVIGTSFRSSGSTDRGGDPVVRPRTGNHSQFTHDPRWRTPFRLPRSPRRGQSRVCDLFGMEFVKGVAIGCAPCLLRRLDDARRVRDRGETESRRRELRLNVPLNGAERVLRESGDRRESRSSLSSFSAKDSRAIRFKLQFGMRR